MRLRAKISDLRAAEHAASPGDGAGESRRASLARDHGAALAAIKRELAAVLVVGLAAIPLVALWLDGVRELVVLAGYGIGAAIWIRVRVLGLLLAARARRGPAGDGASRDDDGT